MKKKKKPIETKLIICALCKQSGGTLIGMGESARNTKDWHKWNAKYKHFPICPKGNLLKLSKI